MSFDLYGTAPAKPKAPSSIDSRIAAAHWQQKGGLWIIRVLDVCEYLKHGDKHGDEFFCCEFSFDFDRYVCCWHEDRDDPADSVSVDVIDLAGAKSEAIILLDDYIKRWEETWEANNADWEYEERRREKEEAAYLHEMGDHQ